MSRVLLLALLAVACGDRPAAVAADAAPLADAPPFPDAALSFDAPPAADAHGGDAGADANPLVLECRALRQRWAALVSGLETTCLAAEDCVAIGKNQNSTCDAFPMLASRCDGDAVRKSAYTARAAELDPISAEFAAKCVMRELCPGSDLGCTPRCSPAADVTCIHAVCVPFSPVCTAASDAGPS